MPAARPVAWIDETNLTVDGTPYTLLFADNRVDALPIFKPRTMMDAYEPIIEEFAGGTIVELGIYRGGSTAYLAQRCAPRKLIAFEREPDRLPLLDRFIEAHGLQDTVVVHHGVDQADATTLSALIDHDLGGEPIDLVIDDASHQYGPTVASFDVLFPRLRQGGLYVVEDWNGDDLLVRVFLDAIAADDKISLRMIENRIVEDLDDPGSAAVPSFESFCVRACCDPAHPMHEPVARWFAGLEAADAAPSQRALAARLREVDGFAPEGDLPTSPVTLGTMAVELLLAVKAGAPAFDAVTVTPWWFAIRRGGPVGRGDISLDLVGRDALGVLDTHRLVHPAT